MRQTKTHSDRSTNMQIPSWIALLALLFFTLACGSGIYIEPPKLKSIEISSENNLQHLAIGQNNKLTVTGYYNNQSKKDVSSEVKWSLSNEDIISIDSDGKIKALAPGSTEILAVHPADESILRASYTMRVNPKLLKIEVTSEVDELIEESRMALKATGYYSDETKSDMSTIVSWSVDDAKLAQFESGNTLYSRQQGKIIVTARYFTLSAEKELTIAPLFEKIVASPDKTQYFVDDKIVVNVKTFLIDGSDLDVSDKVNLTIEPIDLVKQTEPNTFIIRDSGDINIQAEFKGRFSEFTLSLAPNLYLYLDSVSPTETTLSWKAQEADSYILYWDTQENVDKESPAFRDINEEKFVHPNTELSKTYYYRLAYIKNGNESEPGPVLKVTPQRGQWAQTAPITASALTNPATAIIDKQIYLVGGKDKNDKVQATNVSLDITNNTTTKLSPLVQEVHQAASCELNGMVYLFGGHTDAGGYINDTQIYHPETTNTSGDVVAEFWETIPAPATFQASASLACAVVGEKIYVYGGRNETEIFSSFHEFDPNATPGSEWTEILVTPGTTPDRRFGHGLVVIGNILYLLGGSDTIDNTQIFDDVWAYDTLATLPSWEVKTAKSSPRLDASYITYKGKIYVFGGASTNGTLNTAEVYSPDNDSWQALPDMLESRWQASAVTQDSIVHLLGGSTDTNTLPSENILSFDLLRNTWLQKPDLPIERRRFTSQTYGDSIYIFGGNTQGGPASIYIERFDIKTGQWNELTQIGWNKPRIKSTSIIFQGEIFLIGGANQTNEAQPYVDALNPETGKWRSINALPKALQLHSTCALNDGIYVFGGLDADNAPNSSIYFYSAKLELWKEIGSMPGPRYEHRCSSLNNRIYVYGGRDESGKETGTMDVYNPITRDWKAGTDMLEQRASFANTIINGDIIVFGGTNNDQEIKSVEKYSPFTQKWTSQADLPGTRSALNAETLGGQTFIFGGLGDSSNNAHIEVLH